MSKKKKKIKSGYKTCMYTLIILKIKGAYFSNMAGVKSMRSGHSMVCVRPKLLQPGFLVSGGDGPC